MCLEYRTKQQREPFKYPFGSLNQFSIHQRANEGRQERMAQENLSIVWIQSHSDKILHNFNSVTGKQHFFWQPLREQVWTSLDKSCLEIERIFLLYFHLQAKFKPSDKKCQNFETRQKRNFVTIRKFFRRTGENFEFVSGTEIFRTPFRFFHICTWLKVFCPCRGLLVFGAAWNEAAALLISPT